MERAPMDDLVVVVPGILGSRLGRKGKVVYDLSAKGVRRFLKELRHGELIVHGDGESPEDDIEPLGLVDTVTLLPGIWSVDGYTRLLDQIRRSVQVTDGENLVGFAYDWRLSNRYNGKRLGEVVLPLLDRWRASGPPERRAAKLVLVCHSMGGLVARWFCEKEGGAEHTRTLVTIGTPHQGALKALAVLSNGVRLGPLVDLSPLANSLPSVHQLLPTYRCIDVDGQLRRLAEVSVPELDAARTRAGLAFHDELRSAIAARGATARPYTLVVYANRYQPTFQSARLVPGGVKALRAMLGKDERGDGTVPSFAAIPPEWESDAEANHVADRHASMPAGDSVLYHLLARLTPADPRRYMEAVDEVLSLDLPEVILAGEPLDITVETPDPSLALDARLDNFEAGTTVTYPVPPSRDGGYHATITGVPAGTYRLTVEPVEPGLSVKPVTEFFTVWS